MTPASVVARRPANIICDAETRRSGLRTWPVLCLGLQHPVGKVQESGLAVDLDGVWRGSAIGGTGRVYGRERCIVEIDCTVNETEVVGIWGGTVEQRGCCKLENE